MLRSRRALGSGWWLGAAVWLVCVALVPVVAKWWRGAGGVRCAYDGQAVQTRYGVDVDVAGGPSRQFCDLHCARQWLLGTGVVPEQVWVRDEETGGRLALKEAILIRSQVVVNRLTGFRVHVFAEPTRADRHARQYRGERISVEQFMRGDDLIDWNDTGGASGAETARGNISTRETDGCVR